MHFKVIARITGILVMLFSLTVLAPAVIALLYGEITIRPFVSAFLITFSAGLLLWLPGRSAKELRSRDGFLITVLFYLSLGGFGALPIYLMEEMHISFTNALFESFSGLTTTGATILTGLDGLPRSILFYRQLLQWLGGMGIIVLAVAILPMLGVGGMQLYRAESPGPVKDSKLTPRITETAKALWYVYLSLTLLCAAGYWSAGMTLFDAICHSFSTVSIGGFSTHDESIAFFDSPGIEAIAVLFMIICGVNFGLHFSAWNRRTLKVYLADLEVKFYLRVLVLVCLITVWVLSSGGVSASPWRSGIFQAVSMATTTGFTTNNFSLWPSFLPLLLLLAAFSGGCAGSTAGGLKIVRVMLIYRQGMRELKRLVHPSGVFPIKLGKQVVQDRVIEAVWGFFSVYVIIFLTMVCLLLGLSELDFIGAFSAVGATLNNLGPGLGEVALNYQALPDTVKWILILAMLLGRLEIFTLLVLLTPTFWRR